MPKIYLALYKGRKSIRHPRDLWPRLSDGLVRLLTRSPYSHCEIAVQWSDGLFACYSSSLRDGGVRCKVMRLPSDKWDLIEINKAGTSVSAFFVATQSCGYDWLGVVGFPWGLNMRDKWFCSEWCACVLGLPNPHRYTPSGLAVSLN